MSHVVAFIVGAAAASLVYMVCREPYRYASEGNLGGRDQFRIHCRKRNKLVRPMYITVSTGGCSCFVSPSGLTGFVPGSDYRFSRMMDVGFDVRYVRVYCNGIYSTYSEDEFSESFSVSSEVPSDV